jgi:hypothetical protein
MKLSPLNIMLKAWKPAHSRAKRLTQTMSELRNLIPAIRFTGRVRDSVVAGKVRRARKMKITVESERLLVVVQQRAIQSWCPDCGSEVRMVRLDEAAAIAAVSHKVIARRIDSHRVHFVSDSKAEVLICLNSLLQASRHEIQNDG